MNKQLIKKAIKGHKESLAKLFVSIQDESYRVAYGYLGNEHDSMDAVCNAVEKALTGIKKLQKPRYFKTWFIRIVINESKMIMRNQSKVIYLRDNVYHEHRIKKDDMQCREISLDISKALSRLEMDERSLVYMKYYLEYSFREIAEIHNMPESTVKSKVYSILDKLKIMMDIEGFETINIQ